MFLFFNITTMSHCLQQLTGKFSEFIRLLDYDSRAREQPILLYVTPNLTQTVFTSICSRIAHTISTIRYVTLKGLGPRLHREILRKRLLEICVKFQIAIP